MVMIIPVVALWAATLVAADEDCLLQTFPPSQELHVEEESTMAADQAVTAVTCPTGFEDTSYNWTGEGGFPSGGPLTELDVIGPCIQFVKFRSGASTNCKGAAIWNFSNNDNSSSGQDQDLWTCPDNQLYPPHCNILVVQQKNSDDGLVNDCAPNNDGKPRIQLTFTEPTTLIGLSYWDHESDGDLRIRYNSSGTIITTNLDATGNAQGKSVFFNNAVEVTDWELRFKGSGGVNGVRYCKRTTVTPPPGDVTGDPHITTLDGNHYTLMNQGSFSLWRFSGLQASDVDWQIYTHYSGHQSFTKGLLLVDQSAKRFRQALEITSKDCKWRARTEGNEWEVVQQPQLFSAEGTSFNLTNHHVRLYMNSKSDGHDWRGGHDGHREVAVLSFRCRPSHFMNLAIKMSRPEDLKFVEGELRAARKAGTSLLQTTDAEFEQHKSWTALGGSGDARVYLEATDEAATSKFVSHCHESEKADAAKICAKHLGEKMQKETGANADIFSDCVYDVCMGAGEVAAELAAELQASKVM